MYRAKSGWPERIIAFDYDGTLAPGDSWPGHGDPFPEMIALVDKLRAAGYRVCVHTARDSLDALEIARRTGITEVHTGKPVADLYIDDRSLLTRPDLLEGFIEQCFSTTPEYLVKLASGQLTSPYAENIANDRTAVGELPGHADDNFRITIPLTGGMDSTTLWQMGVESGLPLFPVYLDMGQEYAKPEIELARALANKTGHVLTVLDEHMPFVRHDFVMLGRNAVIIYTLADLLRDRGLWGELWFGNYGSESPVLGGDKSRRFFSDTQTLLNLHGYDLRVCSPLIGMDKADEVAYWLSRDIDVLIGSKSCFSPTHHACGECQPCFKKWVAFQAHGIDIRDSFARQDLRVSFDDLINKYKDAMGRAKAQGDYSHYSPSRVTTTLSVIRDLEVNL